MEFLPPWPCARKTERMDLGMEGSPGVSHIWVLAEIPRETRLWQGDTECSFVWVEFLLPAGGQGWRCKSVSSKQKRELKLGV